MQNSPRIWLGIILMVIGAMTLLNQLNFLYFDEANFISVIIGIIAVGLLVSYRSDKQVWKLICGVIALGVAGLIYLMNERYITDDYLGVLVLYGIGICFLAVFLRDRKMWWALIPGGVLLTIGTMVFLEESRFIRGDTPGAVFFLGVALTFGLLYRMRTAENNLGWAKWPAIACLALCVVILGESYFYYAEDFVFPVLLIAVGAWLIGRNYLRNRDQGNSEVTVSGNG